MALGGGQWLVQNKILPGAYINFASMSITASMGERGIATLPLSLDWGADGQIIRVDAAEFNKIAKPALGYDPTAPQLLLVREALKRASALLVWRINAGGTKASAALDGLTATAKHAGIRGNALKVAIEVDLDDNTLFRVTTYLDGDVVDVQTVATSAELVASNYIAWSGEGLAATAGTPLAGGTNGTATGQSYADYLTAVEVESFNVIGYPGDDVATQNLFAAFVKRLRDDEGNLVVGVLAGYPADSEGIINVANGVKLNTGEELTAAQSVAWVAGASAGAEVNESLTNTVYDGAVDVVGKLTKSQYEQTIKAGKFVFYFDGVNARVVSDINSLTTFTPTKDQNFSSNRVIRVLDGWGNDVARIFGQSYMGVVTNSETGRMLFKADLVALGGQYQSIDAISDFSADNIEVVQGDGKRDVLVNMSLIPNDSMERLYMTVRVQ